MGQILPFGMQGNPGIVLYSWCSYVGYAGGAHSQEPLFWSAGRYNSSIVRVTGPVGGLPPDQALYVAVSLDPDQPSAIPADRLYGDVRPANLLLFSIPTARD
jgi:hypothetical protein